MRSNRDSETEIKTQETLVSINDITLKIKKELKIIEELGKENGHLQMVINEANQTLSKKVQEMGMDVAEIISESASNDKLESNLLGSITSAVDTEKLLEHMGP